MKNLFGIFITVLFLVGCGSDAGNLTIKGAGSSSTSIHKGVDLQASNPASLKLKIYKVAFSMSALCTNLQTVYEVTESAATYTNFLDNPAIAQNANLADGTYKCVAIEFSDNIKPTTTSADGVCSANTEFTADVCRTGTSYTLIDGTTGDCTGADNHVAMWLSTGSTETTGTNNHTAFQPPTSEGDAAHGFKLLSSFVKAGAKTGTFVVNGTGKISGSGSSCEMQPPLFSFE